MKSYFIVSIVVLLSGIAIGRFTLPAKIVEKEKIVYQDRIVEKQVIISEVKKKSNKQYVKIEHIAKDGSRTTETRIIDLSTQNTASKASSEKLQDTHITQDKEKVTINNTGSTLVTLGVKANPSIIGMDYGILIHKKLLGPFWFGAFGYTDKSFGADIGLMF